MSEKTAMEARQELVDALIRLNDEDWGTFDGLTSLTDPLEWPLGARELREAIMALLTASNKKAGSP